MATEGDALDADELRVAELMLQGREFRKIGEELGFSHTHAWRISRRPHVAAWVEASQRAAQDALRRAVVRVAPIAVQTLASVAGDKSVSASARVAAASKLADLAIPRQSSVELSGPSGGALRIDIGPDTPDDVLERLAAAED